jgi:hypothetical protein
MVPVRAPTGKIIYLTPDQFRLLQQQQLQAQQAALGLGGANAQGIRPPAAAGANQQGPPMGMLQQQQQQQQHNNLQMQAAGLANMARPPQQQQQAAAPPAAPQPPPTTANFLPDQLATLKEQIVVFKKAKKGVEKVAAEELSRCKPKPLPAPPQAQQLAMPTAAALAAAANAAAGQPAGALGPAFLPPGAAALQQQQGVQLRQQLPPGNLAAFAAGPQQQQQVAAAAAAAAALASRAGSGPPSSGGMALPPGAGRAERPGDAAAAGGVKPPEQLGPSVAPMSLPVRRFAGPVLSIVPPGAEAPREWLVELLALVPEAWAGCCCWLWRTGACVSGLVGPSAHTRILLLTRTPPLPACPLAHTPRTHSCWPGPTCAQRGRAAHAAS